jgi:hypothetical protein
VTHALLPDFFSPADGGDCTRIQITEERPMPSLRAISAFGLSLCMIIAALFCGIIATLRHRERFAIMNLSFGRRFLDHPSKAEDRTKMAIFKLAVMPSNISFVFLRKPFHPSFTVFSVVSVRAPMTVLLRRNRLNTLLPERRRSA